MGRFITSINFMLTTHCNMACPDCCAGITAMPKEKRKFMTWKEMTEAAKYLIRPVTNVYSQKYESRRN